jgi:ABC-type antimicrobial peptide transport system permease subunit
LLGPAVLVALAHRRVLWRRLEAGARSRLGAKVALSVLVGAPVGLLATLATKGLRLDLPWWSLLGPGIPIFVSAALALSVAAFAVVSAGRLGMYVGPT